ncbi:MAG: hypothetical protein RLZZ522_1317 [Verrucomicrobiota bacterium]
MSLTSKVSDGAGGLTDVEMKLGVWVQPKAGYGTSDGRVLIYNCHIGTGSPEIKLPASDHGLPDANACLLYEISSVIPEELLPLAENAGLVPQPGARGLMVNASPEALTKLLVFGSGSMKR